MSQLEEAMAELRQSGARQLAKMNELAKRVHDVAAVAAATSRGFIKVANDTIVQLNSVATSG